MPKLKIRKTWVINPVTRVKKDKKKYDKKFTKKEIREILHEEDF
jgi:hypothetical protein